MSFKELVLTSTSGDGTLPWIKDFVTQNPQYASSHQEVITLSFGNKGVLIVTEYYKAFLFRSNKYYEYLLEAVNVWVTNGVPTCSLVVKYSEKASGNVSIGIDDELETTWTKKTESLFSTQGGSQGSLSTQKDSNPLLTPTSKTPVSQKGRGATGKGGRAKKTDAVGEAARSLAKAFEAEAEGIYPDTDA